MNLSVKLCNSWMRCIFIWICIHVLNTESSCLFPTTWKDKDFKDSVNGSVTGHFYSDFVFWPFTVYGTNIASWTCHDSNENEIVIKGFNTVTHNSQTLYAYRCLLYTDTANNMFYYFPVRDVTDGSRVILSTSQTLSICDVCSSIEPELHTVSLQGSPSCDCTPSCSDLTATGTCSQIVDLSNVQCTLSTTTTATATTVSSNIPTTAGPTTSAVSTALPSSSNTSNTTSKKSEDVFTVEVIVILCASLLVLCLILVTSTVAIVIYNRHEQLRRQFLKVRKVRPAETA